MRELQPEKTPPPRKNRIWLWVAGVVAGLAVLAVAFYVLTTPDSPSQAAERYIEDHYDALAETVTYAAFSDSPLTAEILAEVLESIAERIVPYSCNAPASDGLPELDARCNLSFTASVPVSFDIIAPFLVSMDLTGRDLFGRTVPEVTGADLIETELEVKGLSIQQLQQMTSDIANQAEDAIDKAGDKVDQAGDGIKNLLDR